MHSPQDVKLGGLEGLEELEVERDLLCKAPRVGIGAKPRERKTAKCV